MYLRCLSLSVFNLKSNTQLTLEYSLKTRVFQAQKQKEKGCFNMSIEEEIVPQDFHLSVRLLCQKKVNQPQKQTFFSKKREKHLTNCIIRHIL